MGSVEILITQIRVTLFLEACFCAFAGGGNILLSCHLVNSQYMINGLQLTFRLFNALGVDGWLWRDGSSEHNLNGSFHYDG